MKIRNTIPTPVFNFLKHYDWSGKRIIPFVTSGDEDCDVGESNGVV